MTSNSVTSKQIKDPLFILVKSMTKSEKRSFKLYANRTQSSTNTKFIRLFDILDKLEVYNEAIIYKKAKGVSPTQLSNTKRHLYKQILISLRLLHIQKNVDIEIREQLDFARILYGKGMYLESLKILERVKETASSHHQDILLLEILEFQKLIEERHITRSRKVKNKVEDLIDEAFQTSKVIETSCKLSNLKIKMHGWYIQIGHVKDDKDSLIVKEYFRSNLPLVKIQDLSFFEKVYLYQSYVWYHFILLEFKKCMEYAMKWTELFHSNKQMIDEDPALYMRGIAYTLTSAFNIKDKKSFEKYLDKFEAFEKEYQKKLNPLSQTLLFLYISTARMNRHFLMQTFAEGVKLVPKIQRQLKKYAPLLDVHRTMVFNYKIAYLYMGNGDYNKALDCLNVIINLEAGHLREDLQSYARIMQVLSHYELGNRNLLPYLIKSIYRFLNKVKELNKTQKLSLDFFNKIINIHDAKEEQNAFKEFVKTLKKISKDPYEKRSFLYLDVLSWAEGKVKEKTKKL